MANKSIGQQFMDADAKRTTLLDECRQFSALTIPDVLPLENKTVNDRLERCWTNTGGEGMENMVGRSLTALFPIGLPWFHKDVSAEVRASTEISEDDKLALYTALMRRELLMASLLESTNYRLAKRSQLESVYICGNGLTRMASDYSHRYFRFDNWVCRRGGAGNLLWTITREKKYASELTEQDREKCKVKPDQDEPVDLYTRCQWDTEVNYWHVEQEINEVVLRSAWEKFNPYNVVTYRLCPGEDYARGFIDVRMPDLTSANSLWQALLFGMANAAKMLPVVDPSEPNLRPQDLLKPNGQPVAGRVVNGAVQGVAFLQTNKSADFSIAFQGAQALEQRLGRSMLMEAAAMPKGERVTATAVMRIANELQGALGGLYAQIATECQKPMLEYLEYQMERDALLVPFSDADKKRLVKTDILTGAAALAKEMRFERLMAAVQQIVTLPGEAERINYSVLADRMLYLVGEELPGLIKTPDQLAAETNAKMQQALGGMESQQAIETIGKVVEERAKQTPPQ